MKSVLYVAAALMIGASIYGFVDYSKTSHHKEFETMYHEDETTAPVVSEEKTQADAVIPAVSKGNLVVKEKEPVKREIKPGTIKASKQQFKKFKKKRRVNYKSFSRAPLREEVFVAPEIKEVTVKEQ